MEEAGGAWTEHYADLLTQGMQQSADQLGHSFRQYVKGRMQSLQDDGSVESLRILRGELQALANA